MMGYYYTLTTNTSSTLSAPPLSSDTSSRGHRPSSEGIIIASLVTQNLFSNQNLKRWPLHRLCLTIFSWTSCRSDRLGFPKKRSTSQIQTSQAGSQQSFIFTWFKVASFPGLPRRQVKSHLCRNMLVIWDIDSGKSLYGAPNKEVVN